MMYVCLFANNLIKHDVNSLVDDFFINFNYLIGNTSLNSRISFYYKNYNFCKDYVRL